jgi:hypothetical protein
VNIDGPVQPVIRQNVPGLLDVRQVAERENFLSLAERDLVLKLGAADTASGPFDGDPECLFILPAP